MFEDVTRVISSMAMQEPLKMIEPKIGIKTPSRLQEFLSQKSLQHFIYKEKSTSDYVPILCYKGSQKINDFEANVLVDICEACPQVLFSVPCFCF